ADGDRPVRGWLTEGSYTRDTKTPLKVVLSWGRRRGEREVERKLLTWRDLEAVRKEDLVGRPGSVTRWVLRDEPDSRGIAPYLAAGILPNDMGGEGLIWVQPIRD